MKVEVFKFLAEEEYTDNEKLFFWFMTKIIDLEGPDQIYTLSKYDLVAMLRGTAMGAYVAKSVPARVKEWFNIGFVTDARLTITLTPKAQKYFVTKKGVPLCGKNVIELKDQSTIARYLYLLGVFSATNEMFYDDIFWGIGKHTDREYHHKTKRLSRIEITELLNAQLDK